MFGGVLRLVSAVVTPDGGGTLIMLTWNSVFTATAMRADPRRAAIGGRRLATPRACQAYAQLRESPPRISRMILLVLQSEFMINALLDAEDCRLRLAVERCGWRRVLKKFRSEAVPKGGLIPGELAMIGARCVAVRRALVG